MDTKCKEALKKMRLPHLIEKFAENNMDYDALLLLKKYPESISTIVPTVRDALILREGLESLNEEINTSFSLPSEGEYILPISWQPEIESPECEFQSQISSRPTSDQREFEEENLESPEIHLNKKRLNREIEPKDQPAKNYIQEVLEKTAIGKSVIALHGKRGLDNSSRCKLAELVIYAEYGANTNTLISKPRFLELANLIVQCFSGEFQETYYIPSSVRGKGCAASGKLYDAYTNLNKTLRKTELRNCLSFFASSSPSSGVYSSPSLPTFPSQLEPQEDFDVQRKLDFLRTHLEPWEELKACWESTSLIRQRKLCEDSWTESKVAECINRYPILKQPGGHLLLEIDFAVLFKEAQHNWSTKWPVFSEKLKAELVRVGVKEDSLDCETALIYEIPKLFAIVPVRILGRKAWRATRAEIQEGFLVHLKIISDLQKTLEGMRKSVQYRGTQLQPFPLIVGESLKNISSSYVVIYDRPIRVESPSRAIEVAFKVYHSLNCHYPVQSARVWILLAKAVFGIEEEWEKGMVTPELSRLIKILQC